MASSSCQDLDLDVGSEICLRSWEVGCGDERMDTFIGLVRDPGLFSGEMGLIDALGVLLQ